MDNNHIDYDRYIVKPDGTVIEKKERRFITAKNLILAAVCLIIIILAVLAWFGSFPTARATGMSLISSASKGLQVCQTEDGEYSSEITIENTHFQNNIMPLLSGNGLTLFKPLTNGNAEPIEGKWNELVSNSESQYDIDKNCYQFDLYFKADQAENVYLSSESFVNPLDITDESRQIVGADENIFSADHVAGASRIALLNGEGNQLLKTWIPNEKYELTYHQDETQSTTPTTPTEGTTAPNPGDTGQTFYLWVSTTTSSEYQDMYESLIRTELTYNATLKTYVVNASLPSNSGEYPFFITNSPSTDFNTAYKNNTLSFPTITNISFEGGKVMMWLNDNTFILGANDRNGNHYEYKLNGKIKNQTGSISDVAFNFSPTNGITTDEVVSPPSLLTGWIFTDNGTPETTYSYYTGNSVATLHEYGTSNTNGYITTPSAIPSTVSPGTTNTAENNNYIITLEDTDNDGFYTGHIKIRMWIEGYDREAQNPMMNGRISWRLNFQAADIK